MAGFFGNKNVNEGLSERQLLTRKYTSARGNLLLVVLFTAINIVLTALSSNLYFLFSAFIPFFLVDWGCFLCGMYPEEYYAAYYPGMEAMDNSVFFALLALALVITALYLLCWFLTKKINMGWMVAALVFFGLDTVAMFVLMGFQVNSIIDIVFHGWVIVSLVSGIIACNKLAKLPPEEVIDAEVVVAATEETAEENSVFSN